MTSISPLLAGSGLPSFQTINADQVSEDIPQLLSRLETKLQTHEQDLSSAIDADGPLHWSQVMGPLQQIGESLRWSWGVVSHLNGVCNSPELREAHAAQQPEVVRLGNRLGQSRVIYQALCLLRDKPAESLNPAQQRVLSAELLSMDQRGVGLDGDEQTAFNAASERLAQLSTQFGNHVLDATQAWTLRLSEPSDVDGLPQRALESCS